MIPARRSVAVTARAAGCTQSALRIEQEHARCNNLLAFLQPVSDLYAGGELHAHGYRPRLKTITSRHEDVLLQTRINDGITWYGQDVVSRGFKHRGSIQAGLQSATGVPCGEANSKRTRPVGQRGIDKVHA